jgi:amidase
VTSLEVVDACLRRVAEVNPAVNAATVVFEDRARRAAEDADAALRYGGADVGPLHGVPFSVKENVDLAWSATTNGLPLLKDAIPEADGTHVARRVLRR